ncbi:MAG: flagellar hook-length control protein FliK [Zoogloeaceae bacterium]|nr:flagellar hook-length control protein FliK [Zoogloeaceae bacterium]
MTISLVSAAASGGTPLAALTGDARASGDIFATLFGQLLAGAQDVNLLDAARDSDLSAALTQLPSAMDEPFLNPAALMDLVNADAAVLGQLPEKLQSLLRDLKKRLAQEEEAATPIPLLGALSTPIELPQEIVSGPGAPQADAEFREPIRLMQQLAGMEKAVAELLTPKSANLAANPEKFPEDFGQLLRENLLQGQVQNQSTSGATAQSVGIGRPGLQTPVMSHAWAQEFGEKIVWMARSGQQTAQLSLNPAHLGPLTIHLNLDAEKASATFTATTAEVRQAIEEAMPRLREMLAAAGVALGETSVGTQTRQEWHAAQQQATQQEAQNSARRNAREARSGRDGAILEDHLPTARVARTQYGMSMVDLFA